MSRTSLRPRSSLLCVLVAVACTAQVDDDPFSTIGMSGATAPGTDADTSGGSDTGGDDGSDTTADDGGSTAADGSSGEPTDGECMPACDPATEVCVAGQCVAPGPPAAGELVFSELMPNPDLTTDDDGEWIELTNVGPGPVDVEGCVLYDTASDEDVIDSGAPIVVPPGGTVVLAKTVDPALNGGITGVAYGFGTSYTLTNTGDEVQLVCGGVTIDEVAFDDTWPFDAGVAMQLDPASLDAAANDVVASWCAATTAYGVGDLGTPGQANPGC